MDDCGHLGPKFKVDDMLDVSASCASCIADEIETMQPGQHVVWRIDALPYETGESIGGAPSPAPDTGAMSQEDER